MRTKNISFVLFFLIIAGVVLLNYSKARAEINLGDGICSPQEAELNFCISSGGYVIEVLLCDDGNWPCLAENATVTAFKYRATAPAGCTDPTWSYTVTQWEICNGDSVDYILDTSPPGSALTLPNDKVSKCPEITNDNDHELFKLNPTLNCSDVTQTLDFIIYADHDAGLSCGNLTWVRTRDGCGGSSGEDQLLRGPGCNTGAPIETTRIFGNGTTKVNYDICTGIPTSVDFVSGQTDEGRAWICVENNPSISGNTVGCSGRVNAGPDSSGCLIEGSTTYLYGRTAYSRR